MKSKSRHLPAMQSAYSRWLWRSLPWLVVLLLLWTATSVFAQQDQDPPLRAAEVSFRQGSVVFAPEGENEWVDLPQNRPLTAGDRLWTDAGARAELQVGAGTLHIDSQSHLGISVLDERASQFILMQGTLNAHVRDLALGENFEIDTPNLAFRVNLPGDYRIDVSADGRQTRVVVLSGAGIVYGQGGQAVNFAAGQQGSFVGRDLAEVQGERYLGDSFGQWAAERNRAADLSQSARYLPTGVVGETQLDPYGTWNQDPTYGPVWYPDVAANDWAPYRYGHWDWIAPWGWTWIDDAPWGFAPFHYGRWTVIGQRWAWVPGRMAARPAYSPALVVFLGGGPAVGWYPLAPGEAWWPAYHASNHYVGLTNVGINLNAYPRQFTHHAFRDRPWAITSVRVDDFRNGRPVHKVWQPLQTTGLSAGVVPPQPDRRAHAAPNTPRLQLAPPANTRSELPSRFWAGTSAPPGPQAATQPRNVSSPIAMPARPQVQGGRVVEATPSARSAEFERAIEAQRQADRMQRTAEKTALQARREQELAARQQAEAWRVQHEQVIHRAQELAREQQETLRQQQSAQQAAHQGEVQRRQEAWQQQHHHAVPMPAQQDRGGDDAQGFRGGRWGRG